MYITPANKKKNIRFALRLKLRARDIGFVPQIKSQTQLSIVKENIIALWNRKKGFGLRVIVTKKYG